MSLREKLERLDLTLWRNDKVSIRPIITEADLIYAGYECQLTDEQKELVNPFWFSIGRAYLNRDDNYPCIILNESGEPVGFINLSKWIGTVEAYSWSYFIHKDMQGKGYGKAAARLAVQILKAADPSKMIKISAEKCNTKAHRLYESLGFKRLDEMDGDDFVFGL